jgi:hypothetical protein
VRPRIRRPLRGRDYCAAPGCICDTPCDYREGERDREELAQREPPDEPDDRQPDPDDDFPIPF